VRRLAIAYLISAVGTAMGALAVAFVAYARTESVLLTAVAFGGNTLPFVVLAPLSGRLLTRFDLRYVLAADQVARAAVWGVVAIVAALGRVEYPLLLAANYTFGCLTALTSAGWPRLLEIVSPPGRLPDLSALFRSIPAAASVAGALIGGTALFVVGHHWVFAFDALSYLPAVAVLLAIPAQAALPRQPSGVLRSGMSYVRQSPALRRAFVLIAALNFAALPLLSALPAVAHEVDARGHVLGLLTGAYYAGGMLVVWAVIRLRRRFAYSRILFVGFAGAGVLLLANAVLTDWRNDGLDAVAVAISTLVPIGLAIAVNTSLLQALVVLECPNQVKAGVLVLYATTAAVLTPLGGVLLGAAIDSISLWTPLAVSGALLTVLAVTLRVRLRVFDDLQPATEHRRVPHSLDDHWHMHLRYSAGADIAVPPHPSSAAH
jgi:MFS family permease